MSQSQIEATVYILAEQIQHAQKNIRTYTEEADKYVALAVAEKERLDRIEQARRTLQDMLASD